MSRAPRWGHALWMLALAGAVPMGGLVTAYVSVPVGLAMVLCALVALLFESGAGEMPEPTVAGTSWICSECQRRYPVLEMRLVDDDILCPRCAAERGPEAA